MDAIGIIPVVCLAVLAISLAVVAIFAMRLAGRMATIAVGKPYHLITIPKITTPTMVRVDHDPTPAPVVETKTEHVPIDLPPPVTDWDEDKASIVSDQRD